MEKFYRLIGEILLKVGTLAIVVTTVLFIVSISYEKEKDEMFFEAMQYFNEQFEIEVDTIHRGDGILDEDEIMEIQLEYKVKTI